MAIRWETPQKSFGAAVAGDVMDAVALLEPLFISVMETMGW